jgi:photosystem II stability/assembly factor-like uncharacterized protein
MRVSLAVNKRTDNNNKMKSLIISLGIITSLTVSAIAQSSGWTVQQSPATQNLHGVAYSSPDVWVAVGDGGIIIRSQNGGINWAVISSPVADALQGVSMRGNLGIAVGISGRIVRSTDGGLSWVEVPRPTTRNLYSVSISNSIIAATGHEGTILVSPDNGLTWTPHTAGTASALFGVSAFGSTAVGVGGAGAVVMTINGGSAWGLTIIGNQLTFFYGVSMVNASTVWLVGSTSAGNVIAKSTNSGFAWNAETAPVTDQLFGVSFASTDTGTAVGASGTIIRTTNGGNTWIDQISPTTEVLNGISFVNPNFGIAVGGLGTILRTTSGGVSGVKSISNNIPEQFYLRQNYPNPFNPSTKINFSLPKSTNVKLAVYDMNGKEVEVLVNQNLQAGVYEADWHAANLASGIYFYTLKTNDFTDTKKMILVK